ncbi:MAG: hypothetical protein K8U57_36010 [Planctomycetes bacterium]|nr:hypothetical protein [Planctomycetota bacterium]
MQLTPITLLVSQCDSLTERLEALQEWNPARNIPQPLFAISGLNEDLQRVYAIERILMRLESLTQSVQAEVAEAIGDLLETIGMTYCNRRQEMIASCSGTRYTGGAMLETSPRTPTSSVKGSR